MDSNGRTYVGDGNNGRVKVLDSDYCVIGELGSDLGNANNPYNYLFLTHDSFDNLIVSDSANHCLKFFDEKNAAICSLGERGTQLFQFQSPFGYCFLTPSFLSFLSFGFRIRGGNQL